MPARAHRRVRQPIRRPSLTSGVMAVQILACLLVPAGGAAQNTRAVRLPCGMEVHAGEMGWFRLFPQDETFCPLIADPKQPRSFLALQRGEFGTLDQANSESTTIGAVGLADAFGLARWGGGGRGGDGFHLALAGGIFAQFDMGEPSFDLINADYLVGLPLTWRKSGFSTRLRVYHQSSHLGDEYVLRGDEIERQNLSFEAVEALVSLEAGPLRLYGGGERLFRREPETVDPLLAHAGLELRTISAGPVSLLAGADVKLSEQHDWNPAVSARAGFQLAPAARTGHPLRRVLLLAEFYDGPSPYGQFFLDDIRYFGVGVHLLH